MPSAGVIHRIANRHRRELLAGERMAANAMVHAYGNAWQAMQGEIEALAQLYYDAQEARVASSPWWLFEQERLGHLQRQVEAEMAKILDLADASIRSQQWEAIQAAGRHSQELVSALVQGTGINVSFSRLPAEALTDLVGFLRTGSPLRSLLDELGRSASRVIQDRLIQGLAIGKNPRDVARDVRAAFGGNLSRALTVSRTEMLRSHREATKRNYEANRDVVSGWIWTSAHQERTCPMCLAMDGTKHPLSARLDDHPNGRCTMRPIVRGAPEIKMETGTEWFERQPEDVQRQVLGNAGLEAYQKGEVTLQDMVGRKRSADWGTTRYALPVSKAKEKHNS